MDTLKLSYQLNISTEGALRVNLRDYMERTQMLSVGINAATISNQDNTYYSWFLTDIENVFEPKWLNMLHDTIPGFITTWAAIVYRKPVYNNRLESTAHIDYSPLDHKSFYYGLNFTIHQDDSEMVWYERLDGNIDYSNGSTYFDVNHCELKEIYRANIPSDKLTLVNTSVIHDVDSKGKDRWAVSLRGHDQNEYGSWENSVEFFKPWIINT